MAKSTTKRDVIWGYAAQAINLSAGLLLLPLIVRHLNPEQVSLWFIFLTLASFAQMLDFGFQPTIARNAAYVFAGVSELRKTGVMQGTESGPNYPLLSGLLGACKKIYLRVGLAAAVVMMVGGSGYLMTLSVPAKDIHQVIAGWTLFASGSLLNFYFAYFTPLLQGKGEVALSNKAIFLSRISFLVLAALGLVQGMGLVSLGLAQIASAFLGRWLSFRYFYDKTLKTALSAVDKEWDVSEIMPAIWHNSAKFGMVSVGTFLILRANTLLASSFVGLKVAASYALTIQIFQVLTAFAGVAMQISVPRLSAKHVQGGADMKGSFGAVVVASGAVFVVCCLVVLLLGPTAIRSLHASVALLPMPMLVFMALSSFLESNHTICATFITTRNTVPFVGAAIYSGIASLALTYAGIGAGAGIWAFLLGPAIAQLAYNNWYWPMQAAALCGASFKELVGEGLGYLVLRMNVLKNGNVI